VRGKNIGGGESGKDEERRKIVNITPTTGLISNQPAMPQSHKREREGTAEGKKCISL